VWPCHARLLSSHIAGWHGSKKKHRPYETVRKNARSFSLVNIIFVTWKLICVFYVFFHANSNMLLEISQSPTVFVWQNFLKFSFSEFSWFFFHATSMVLNMAELYYILNIVWVWKLNASPITDSQTVQVQTCTDTFGHETNSKLCLRNTALLVKCLTELW
jgi:hypothetical protein